MTEQLRNLGGLKDEMGHIAQSVKPQGLNDLWDVEKCEVYRMLLQDTECILKNNGLLVVLAVEKRSS